MTEASDHYHPISCTAHDRLLALATLRRECELTVRDAAEVRSLRGVIADVYSQEGAEYLKMQDGTTVRLDSVLAIDGIEIDPPEI